MSHIIKQLEIENFSNEYFELLYRAKQYSQTTFDGRGYVFAQIGINAEPCSVNCGFCSMASSHYRLPSQWQMTLAEIEHDVNRIVASGLVSDLFLMTTADFSAQQFLETARFVRSLIPDQMKLVANVGDFDLEYAKQLKDNGVTGAYHIVRLGESRDTEMPVERRMATIEALKAAGLTLYYCVEPIGPEHSYAEIAQEIERARDMGVDIMAVMRRIAVEGTPLAESGQISIAELCKIAAVAMLETKPKISMNVHEVCESSLMLGVNQLYAEIGANPRDTVDSTELARGVSIAKAAAMLEDFGYKVNIN